MQHDKYPIDYDNNWKEIVSNMIEDCILFFIPKLHADIDFSKPIVFLEQELHDVVQPSEKDRVADKLVRVGMKDGNERWIYIHIEFQVKAESDFSERMYSYYHLIRSKYGKDITALVIYTGKRKPRFFDCYTEEKYGTIIFYKFNTYHVAEQNERQLLGNDNPFAIAVLANYYVLKTTAQQKERLSFKEKLFELATQRGYSYKKTLTLYIFIQQLMRLEPILSKEFKNNISKLLKSSQEMFRYTPEALEIIDIQTQGAYGTTIPQTVEQLKHAQKEAEHAQKEAEHAKEVIRRLVIHCHENLKMPAQQISDLTGESIAEIENIIGA